MNQESNPYYELIAPLKKENRYEGDNWVEKWANYSPRGFLGFFLLGYFSLFGFSVGWAMSTM